MKRLQNWKLQDRAKVAAKRHIREMWYTVKHYLWNIEALKPPWPFAKHYSQNKAKKIVEVVEAAKNKIALWNYNLKSLDNR